MALLKEIQHVVFNNAACTKSLLLHFGQNINRKLIMRLFISMIFHKHIENADSKPQFLSKMLCLVSLHSGKWEENGTI